MEQETLEAAGQVDPDLLVATADANNIASHAELPLRSGITPRPSLFSPLVRPMHTVGTADPDRSSHTLTEFPPQSYFNQTPLGASPAALPELTSHYSRAEKDADDPTESAQSRIAYDRSASSTRTTINKLFAASSPNSQPYSRQTSFLRSCSPKPSMQSLVSEGLALGTHIYNRGLLEGRHSDICLKVFGSNYKLHRLVLEQSPYFSSAFSGPWLEASATEIELHPEETDSNISKEAFELALKRIYGCRDPQEEIFHCLGLFATACWLEMQELINDCVEIIIQTMQVNNLSPVINLVTSNYYGKAGDMILQSATILLRREGATIPTRSWDNIPAEAIKDTIGADEFFVRSEWERWCLAKKLLDRRLKLVAALSRLNYSSPASQDALRALRRAGRPRTDSDTVQSPGKSEAEREAIRNWRNVYSHPDVTTMYDLLDVGINYMHLDFEALQTIKAARDCFGNPVCEPSLISNALWASIELRQKVLSVDKQEPQLGLTQQCDEPVPELLHPIKDSHVELVVEYEPAEKRESSSADGKGVEESSEHGKARKHLIPRCDGNIAIGFSPAPITSSETRKRARTHPYRRNDTASTSFITDDSKASTPAPQDPEPDCYSQIPPFRFSVEFPDLRTVEDRNPLHSQTVFYAGSFWNIYIVKFRKWAKENKLPQLGVYLCRAEDGRQIDSSVRRPRRFVRSVDERIGDLERGVLLSADDQAPTYQSPDSRTAPEVGNYTHWVSTNSHGGQPSNSSTYDADGASAAIHELNSTNKVHFDFKAESSEEEDVSSGPLNQSAVIPPYVDSRPNVKAYFKIFSASSNGRSLNIWESIPTNFSKKKSWGWKNSSLMMDATSTRTRPAAGDGGDDQPPFLNLREDGRRLWGTDDEARFDESDAGSSGEISQLRFSVVIGLV